MWKPNFGHPKTVLRIFGDEAPKKPQKKCIPVEESGFWVSEKRPQMIQRLDLFLDVHKVASNRPADETPKKVLKKQYTACGNRILDTQKPFSEFSEMRRPKSSKKNAYPSSNLVFGCPKSDLRCFRY